MERGKPLDKFRSGSGFTLARNIIWDTLFVRSLVRLRILYFLVWSKSSFPRFAIRFIISKSWKTKY